MPIPLNKLTPDEVVERLKVRDLWKLEEILVLMFGFKQSDFNWDLVWEENDFPAREYFEALTATNDIHATKRLPYVRKVDIDFPSLSDCRLKKSDFMRWADKKWGSFHPDLRKNIQAWKKYKSSQTSSPSIWDDTQTTIKKYGDQLQIRKFVEHCKTKPETSFKLNKTEIVKQAQADLSPKIKRKLSTFRKYIRSMPIEELKAARDNPNHKE